MVRPVYIGSEIYRRSTYGSRHPLAIPRVSTVTDLVRALGWLDDGAYLDSPRATPDQLTRFHTPEYVDAVMRAERDQALSRTERERFNIGVNGNPIYGEIFRRPATACGASLAAADLLAEGGIVHSPAGGTHHGRPDRASGFCYFNDPALVPMADDIAESLVVWLKNVEKDPWRGSYGNQSWALVNLLDYAAYRRDFQLIADTLPIARRYFLQVDRPCTPKDQRGGFMATCLVRAMLAARLFDRDDMVAWIDAFLPALDKLQPVTDPRWAHEYGLNFSRAWGLWDVSVATGRARTFPSGHRCLFGTHGHCALYRRHCASRALGLI